MNPELLYEVEVVSETTIPKPNKVRRGLAYWLGFAITLVIVNLVIFGLPIWIWYRFRIGDADEKRCLDALHGVFLPGGAGFWRRESYCVKPFSVLETNK